MWDFRPLRADIERLFGRQQAELIQPCLNSIHDWRGYGRYHYSEAKRLMADAVGDRPHHEVFGVMLGEFDQEEGGFEVARFKAASQITACVHAMHSGGHNQSDPLLGPGDEPGSGHGLQGRALGQGSGGEWARIDSVQNDVSFRRGLS